MRALPAHLVEVNLFSCLACTTHGEFFVEGAFVIGVAKALFDVTFIHYILGSVLLI